MIIDRLLIPSFEISEKTPDDFELESSAKWKGPLISWVSEYQYDNFEFELSSTSLEIYFLAESQTVFTPQEGVGFIIGVYNPLLDEERKIKSSETIQQGQFFQMFLVIFHINQNYLKHRYLLELK